MIKMEKAHILLLELLPENDEVFKKTLEYLHNRGWTFGKGESLLKYEPDNSDDRIYIYDDKTIRIGNLVSAKFCKAKLAIQVEEKIIEGLAGPEYEKWIKDFAKEVEKGVLEGVYGKISF